METKSFDLDTVLIGFTDKKGSTPWTIRDAVQGLQISGGIGSGKTSGSGDMFALKFLANGFGGLVLTVKAEEKAMWQEYCCRTNRLNDLVIIEPGGINYFNFLEYESSDKDSITTNIVQVLKTVIRASEEKSGGKSDDPFWESALDMLIHNVIDLCILAYGKVSVQQMYQIVSTAPKKDAPQEDKKNAFSLAYETASEKILTAYNEWRNQLPPEVEKEKGLFNDAMYKAVPNAELFEFVDNFFCVNFRNLSEKTRSILDFSFSGFLFHLLKEPVYSLFCKHPSNITPDDCLNGKIILLNLPVKKYNKAGRDCQIMFKYIWQRAMEKRNVEANNRPVFLWADEAQQFIHEYDAEYQATARSSRIATVYISQNLPNYYANMGGDKSIHRVNSFLGTLATKIFHANADIETNKYASELIGDAYIIDEAVGANFAGSFSISSNKSTKLERVVRPEGFVGLKTGSPSNNFIVEAYIHRQGQSFHNKLNFKKVEFKQHTYS